MNGPEHYKEAEEMLAYVEETRSQMNGQMVDPMVAIQVQLSLQVTVATAQIHATLALAAATAVTQASAYDGDEQNARSRGWSAVV